MSQTGPPSIPLSHGVQIRRVSAPERAVANQIVIARPLDGSPLVLSPTASAVWSQLLAVTTQDEIEQRICEDNPEVDPSGLKQTVANAVAELNAYGLLQRG